ncbi:hypothetical protein L1276_002236 [Flavobacterium sp. HSC-32F16]|uniref:DUF6268 family outer membrane beta-barrel protein n=1 Tax=Flavobacterium sp. HSC-32F16 TaxID=2910964 RepID=UPI0020A2F6F9|nr:DUF6268 family outer membrane beta-barrel protein [Flavobacterium sp. HSC-32F16]MCP2027092.1 hypothetical protein [Flavobacterium sp. HSC-32F16]
MKAQEKFSVNVNIKTEPTDKVDFNETSIGVFFNKTINAKSSIKNTLQYTNLGLNNELETLGSIDELRQIQDKFEISQKISNSTKLSFSLTPTANFQHDLDFSDVSLLGSLEIKQDLNSKTTLSIGAARTSIFGNPKFLPIASLNYNISENANLLIGFPDSKISYSNNIRNTFSLNNSFNGSFYNLDAQNHLNNTAAKAVLLQMTTSFEYERNVEKNWFLNFKAGYDFDKKYKLTNSKDHTVYDFNTSNGYVLGIGIKYKQ